jgi:hypothetical protein
VLKLSIYLFIMMLLGGMFLLRLILWYCRMISCLIKWLPSNIKQLE